MKTASNRISNFWIWAGLGALVVHQILAFFPDFTNQYYTNGIFQGVRYFFGLTLSRFHLPGIFILLLLFITFLISHFKLRYLTVYWRRELNKTLNVMGGFIFLFYLLWGFNYRSPSMANRLSITIEEGIQHDLISPINSTLKVLQSIRSGLPPGPFSEEWFNADTETVLHENLTNTLIPMGYPEAPNMRCRQVSKNGLLRRVGISGIYLPFSGEGHVDASQLELTKVFTIAHEMSHGFGITNEGEANFAAWLSMSKSEVPVLKYAAELMLLIYQLDDLLENDFERFQEVRDSIPQPIKSDLDLIKENSKKYPQFFPAFSNWVNNLFLVSQGVEAGTKSYSEFTSLVRAYRVTR